MKAFVHANQLRSLKGRDNLADYLVLLVASEPQRKWIGMTTLTVNSDVGDIELEDDEDIMDEHNITKDSDDDSHSDYDSDEDSDGGNRGFSGGSFSGVDFDGVDFNNRGFDDVGGGVGV